MMNKIFIGGGVALFIIISLLVLFKTNQNKISITAPTSFNEVKRSAEKILELSFQDYNGNTVKLADFKGKNLLLNSWAGWCTFCKKELPDFAEIQKDFGDKILIIAIDRRETLEEAKKFSDELDVTAKLIFLLDPADSFYQTIGGFSMPETVFVDREGFIRYHKRGLIGKEELKRRIGQTFGL